MLEANNGKDMNPAVLTQDNQMSPCCEETIDLHGENNPMMVCSACKQIIKRFDDERAYRNYVKFCESRHRKILAIPHQGSHVVIFKNC